MIFSSHEAGSSLPAAPGTPSQSKDGDGPGTGGWRGEHGAESQAASQALSPIRRGRSWPDPRTARG